MRRGLARWSFAHRRIVVAAWLAAFPYARSSNSTGWTTAMSTPIARNPAAICIVQPGFALATIRTPVSRTASAFSCISRPDISGSSTL